MNHPSVEVLMRNEEGSADDGSSDKNEALTTTINKLKQHVAFLSGKMEAQSSIFTTQILHLTKECREKEDTINNLSTELGAANRENNILALEIGNYRQNYLQIKEDTNSSNYPPNKKRKIEEKTKKEYCLSKSETDSINSNNSDTATASNLENTTKDLNDAKEAIAAADDTASVADAVASLEKTKKELVDAKEEIAEAVAVVAAAAAAAGATTANLEKTRKDLVVAKEEIEILRKKVSALNEDLYSEQEAQTMMIPELRKLRDKNRKLQAESSSFSKNDDILEKITQENENLKKQLIDGKQKIEKIVEEVQSIKSKNVLLFEESSKYAKSTSDAIFENEELKKNLEKKQNAYQYIVQDMKSLKNETSASLREESTKCLKYKNKFDDFVDENEQLKIMLRTEEELRMKLAEKLESAKYNNSNNAKLPEQMISSSSKTKKSESKLSKENEELKTKLQQKHLAHKRLVQEFKKKYDETDNKRLRLNKKRLESMLDNANREIEEWKFKLVSKQDAYKITVHELKNQKSKNEKMLEESSNKYKKFESKLEKANKENTNAINDKNKLSKELEQKEEAQKKLIQETCDLKKVNVSLRLSSLESLKTQEGKIEKQLQSVKAKANMTKFTQMNKENAQSQAASFPKLFSEISSNIQENNPDSRNLSLHKTDAEKCNEIKEPTGILPKGQQQQHSSQPSYLMGQQENGTSNKLLSQVYAQQQRIHQLHQQQKQQNLNQGPNQSIPGKPPQSGTQWNMYAQMYHAQQQLQQRQQQNQALYYGYGGNTPPGGASSYPTGGASSYPTGGSSSYPTGGASS